MSIPTSSSPIYLGKKISVNPKNEIPNTQLSCECLSSDIHELGCLLRKETSETLESNVNRILRQPRREHLWDEKIYLSTKDERATCMSSCWALREKKAWTVGGISLGFLISICLILMTYGIWKSPNRTPPEKSLARAVIFTPMIRTLINNFKRTKDSAKSEYDYYNPTLVNTIVRNLTGKSNDSNLLGDIPKMVPRESMTSSEVQMNLEQAKNDKILLNHLLSAIHNNIRRMRKGSSFLRPNVSVSGD